MALVQTSPDLLSTLRTVLGPPLSVSVLGPPLSFPLDRAISFTSFTITVKT